MRTKDFLKYLNIELIQDDEMFRYNTDTTVLGMSLDQMIGKTVMDIGTNNGSLLLYADHMGAKKLIGVDIFSKALDIAKENLEKTNKEFELINSKIQDLDHEPVDVVIINPPFFEMNNVTENKYYKAAMFEETMPIEDIFKALRKFMKDNGEAYVLYPADRFIEFFELSKKYKLKFMKLRFVHEINKPYAMRFVVKLKIGPMTKLNVLSPIMVDNGEIKM